MNRIWQFYPTPLGLYIRLAEEIVPHLDRAGASYSIPLPAEAAAKCILKAAGREFVPPTPGECRELAAKWGLFDPDERGDYHWSSPMTRSDAAALAVRFRNMLEQGVNE